MRSRFGTGIGFSELTWSGGNTHAARMAAAQLLKRQVRELATAHPNAAQFVVAHSHGGNIALLACKDPEVEAALAGIVCLSTPFLQYRESTSAALALTLFILAVTVVSATLINAYALSWSKTAQSAGMIAVVCAGVGLLFYALDRVFKTPPEHFASPTLARDKLLVIRSPGDEASGLLGLSSFAQWALFRVTSRLFSLQERMGNALYEPKRRRYILCALCVALGGVLAVIEPLRAIPAYAAIGLGLVALLPIAVTVLVTPIRFLLLFPFGFDLPFRAFHLTVTAEATPPGEWSVTLIGSAGEVPGAATSEGLEPLMHSESYDHPQAIGLICHWIAGRATAVSGAPNPAS
jgi:hypothetical protein